MRVTLPPDLAKIVKKQIASGRHKSAAEVIREGLANIPTQPRPANIDSASVRKRIQEGIDDLENRRVTVYDSPGLENLVQRIVRERPSRMAKKKRARV